MELVDKTIGALAGEKGKVGNLAISDGLVNLSPIGEALVIGDLHGSLESLETIFEKSEYIEKMALNKDCCVVFLGDYGDRGSQSVELYYCVLKLKLEFPRQIVLLRGNHEGPSDLMASPHDLPIQLQHEFREKWIPIYSKLRELFDYLHLAVYVEGRYLMLHGGLPTKIQNLQQLAQASILHPEKPFLEELLWNDPDESISGTFPSPRGAGNLFGKIITKEILEKLNAKILIRGHEVVNEGFKINHDGKILTLFSARGPPYFNANGAYLDLPLAEKSENAKQLLPYIHSF